MEAPDWYFPALRRWSFPGNVGSGEGGGGGGSGLGTVARVVRAVQVALQTTGLPEQVRAVAGAEDQRWVVVAAMAVPGLGTGGKYGR